MIKQYLRPFVALAGLFLSPVAQAQPACNVGSLQGDYAFTAQGAVLGTIDAAGAVHPFPAPSPINAVAVVTFYGNGTVERVVFTMNNGAPQVAQPPNIRQDGFLLNQKGTYSINEDCTGTMQLVIPGTNNANTTLDFALVLVDFGQRVFAVVSSETVPVVGALAVNVSAEMTRDVPRRR
jgi:hypothetical protein